MKAEYKRIVTDYVHAHPGCSKMRAYGHLSREANLCTAYCRDLLDSMIRDGELKHLKTTGLVLPEGDRK
jgi:hypothetical protein